MRVFITGATGLVGSHVAERLIRDGHSVRTLVRPGGDAGFLRSIGADLREGDVTDRDSLAGALAGCDALVHAAAIVTGGRAWDDYQRVNVEGTENVLAAAAEQDVRRLVHLSSVAVYGGADIARRGGIDEESPTDTPLPPGELYARSKREAEEVVRRYERQGRIELVVVRPDVIYGERDRVVVPLLARHVSAPLILTIGRGDRDLPLVYAANVAGGVALALTVGRAAGRVYNLANDFPVTQRAFLELLARELGRRPRFLPVPYAAASFGALGAETVARLLGGRRPLITRRHVAFMGKGNPFVSRRARAELGWAPEVSHQEGVRRAVSWLRAAGGR